MSLELLSLESLRGAVDDLAKVPRGDVQLASRLVGEVLLASGSEHAALLTRRMADLGATEATAALDGVAPLAVLRRDPRDARERAVLSVLLVRHLVVLLDGEEADRVRLREALPTLDQLEFNGPYAPYAAARVALSGGTLTRFDAVLDRASIVAGSSHAVSAVRALRRGEVDTARTIETPFADGAPTVAGEVEALQRNAFARTLAIVTGWALARGAVRLVGRWVFSYRRPATLSLEGRIVRVVGHSEILGRTLRTFDLRYPLDELVEIRREARFPGLPVAISVVALGVGVTLGARAVVEGAGVAYFPLIAIGLGVILGGLAIDVLMRSLFPGVLGAVRLGLYARDARAVALTSLPVEELDRWLDAVDGALGATALPRPSVPPEKASVKAATSAPKGPKARKPSSRAPSTSRS